MKPQLSRRLVLAGSVCLAFAGLVGLAIWYWPADSAAERGEELRTSVDDPQFAGSVSCRGCHERFYQLWASSHHGLAMQPYTATFAGSNLTQQQEAIRIGETEYRADLGPDQGWITEAGPGGEKRYRIAHVMGGKNVYYFLSPLERGRLQTLPIAYDVTSQEWYDTTDSGVRHFPGGSAGEALDWTDSAYTFNTSCYNCHVSQLSTNYDLEADTYDTAWAEPGINCETCHGPAAEHARVCEAAPQGEVPTDLRLTTVTVSRGSSRHQVNTLCVSCHAKLRPLTTSFEPGDRYFDHFDLVTLESTDFYPDGRDLGENYTYTSWRMSPCVKSGELDCLHCHTSSGRYRFAGEATDQACLPCHRTRVENSAAHHRHPEGQPGSRCVDCHMPKTSFARMTRSDHSMRPPTPATTIAFESPNACNVCHADEDAAWADDCVTRWHSRDFQRPTLQAARLVAAARKRDWTGLPDILAYITSRDRDEVFAVSLIRLLAPCEDTQKYPALMKALKDPSPLIRSAAAGAVAGYLTPPVVEELLEATGDEYRVVRTQAAGALAGWRPDGLAHEDRVRLERADDELLASLTCRPDDWSTHYNLGNMHMTRGEQVSALAAFETAARLRPDAVLPLVNASIAHARLGQEQQAEQRLRQASRLAPANAAVNFNLGLLLAGKGEAAEAERCLAAALRADPGLAQAAYNLGLLLARDRLTDALGWLRHARDLRQDDPKYAYTLAFYLARKGDMAEARDVLEGLVGRWPDHVDACLLLGMAYEQTGATEKAKAVYERGAADTRLPSAARRHFLTRLQGLLRD